jgi:hypothetical protein
MVNMAEKEDFMSGKKLVVSQSPVLHLSVEVIARSE